MRADIDYQTVMKLPGRCSYATAASQAFARGVADVPAMLQLTIWWTRVVYGWLCLPWMALQGFLYPLLMHIPKTAYNMQGRVCPLATSTERKRSRDKRMFGKVDKDKNGLLDYHEFALLLYGSAHLSEDELREMFARLDVDGSGRIDQNEFQEFQRLHDEMKKPKRREEALQAGHQDQRPASLQPTPTEACAVSINA